MSARRRSVGEKWRLQFAHSPPIVYVMHNCPFNPSLAARSWESSIKVDMYGNTSSYVILKRLLLSRYIAERKSQQNPQTTVALHAPAKELDLEPVCHHQRPIPDRVERRLDLGQPGLWAAGTSSQCTPSARRAWRLLRQMPHCH